MLRGGTVLLFVLTLVGCGSGSNATPQIIPPELRLEQIVGPSSTGYVRGPISVQYELIVENRSQENLRLRKLDLRNVGSGAYILRGLPIAFNETIPSMTVRRLQFWVPAIARGGIVGADEPVMLRGIAWFETPYGTYQRVFSQTLMQSGGASPR